MKGSKIAFAVVALSILGLAGALTWSEAENRKLEAEPRLPYSRPHIEFENDAGEECVGWYMRGGLAAVELCEGSPPTLIIMEPAHGGWGDKGNVMYG